MKWIKRHLNWSYLFGWWIILVITWLFSNISSDGLFLGIIIELMFIPLSMWYLREKHRSLWWVILPIFGGGFLILFLGNEHGK